MNTSKSFSEIVDLETSQKHEGTNGYPAFLNMISRFGIHVAPHLVPFLTENRTDLNRESRPEAVDRNPSHTPFQRAFGSPFFELIKNDAEYSKLFDISMTGSNMITDSDVIFKAFDLISLKDGSVVIDVGGGVGGLALGILEIRPDLQCVVQDLDRAVERGKQWFNVRMPGALESGRMKFEVHDFFTIQPDSCRACPPDIFILRAVTHNWRDSEVITILRHLRDASGPNTKLLLIDQVLSDACRTNTGGAQFLSELNDIGSTPLLLENLGQAHRHGIDISMMMMFNAQERTLKDFCVLFDSSGWKLRNTQPNSEGGGPFQLALIIAEPV